MACWLGIQSLAHLAYELFKPSTLFSQQFGVQ